MSSLPAGLRCPWDTAPLESAVPETSAVKQPRGRRVRTDDATGQRAERSWLYHHLMVSGPPEIGAAFVTAARGPGIIPWRLDFERIEEDIFHLAATQPPAIRNLSIDGCRLLARQFRERVEARQARVLRHAEQNQGCPFDLQILLPVPDTLLARGPADPASRAWLAEHWGVPDAPRQVVTLPRPSMGRRLPAGYGVWGWGFFTQETSPHPAIDRLVTTWPELRFRLRVPAD